MHRDEQSSTQAGVGPLGDRHDLPLRLSALSQVGYGAMLATPRKGEDVVNRTEFEALRDLPGKLINCDISFVKARATAPLFVAENIVIINSHNRDVRLSINYNPEVGSKTFNVHIPGVGPICRLDVDGPPHRPSGRSHKHSVQAERCPGRNLPDNIIDRPDLAGKPIRELFGEFCRMANITHTGSIDAPDEEPTGGT